MKSKRSENERVCRMSCCYGRWRRCRLWSKPRFRGASEVLFREPAVLLQLGWAPVQIRSGSNGRHRHPEGRQEESLPCHPDTLRDALRRVGESAWLHAQVAGVKALYQRQLVRGKGYAVDGSGLGDDFRLVALVCVSAPRPIIVAWRLLSGQASEKGQEAAVTRELIEQVLEVAGPQAISLRLSDALYADGPLLAWLKYRQGIDAPSELTRGSSALPRPTGPGQWTADRLDPPSVCAYDPRPQAGARGGGDGSWGADELGRLYREGCQLWGGRCEPVGLSHPRCDYRGNGRRGAASVGEYAQLRRWLCREASPFVRAGTLKMIPIGN